MAPEIQDEFEAAVIAAQAAIDRGARFGKSRLIANGRVMKGLHGVKADPKRLAKQKAQRIARKAQR